MVDARETYVIACHNCQSPFDALEAAWCSCLVTERTLVCASCLTCFCKAPSAYKQHFWSAAPKSLWDRKFQEHHEESAPRPNPEEGAVVRPLVLLVEDEKDVQRIGARVIESLGYGLILGCNGVEGLELARKYHPDLVLTDALMPKMDGREMCRRIKEDSELSGTRVVVMTSLYTSVKHQTEAYKTHKVDDYLVKPLDFNQLRTLLEKHLG